MKITSVKSQALQASLAKVDPVTANMDPNADIDVAAFSSSILASLLEVDITEGSGEVKTNSSVSPGGTVQKKQPRKKTTNKPNPALLHLERQRMEEIKKNDAKLKMKVVVKLKRAEYDFVAARQWIDEQEKLAKEKLERQKLQQLKAELEPENSSNIESTKPLENESGVNKQEDTHKDHTNSDESAETNTADVPKTVSVKYVDADSKIAETDEQPSRDANTLDDCETTSSKDTVVAKTADDNKVTTDMEIDCPSKTSSDIEVTKNSESTEKEIAAEEVTENPESTEKQMTAEDETENSESTEKETAAEEITESPEYTEKAMSAEENSETLATETMEVTQASETLTPAVSNAETTDDPDTAGAETFTEEPGDKDKGVETTGEPTSTKSDSEVEETTDKDITKTDDSVTPAAEEASPTTAAEAEKAKIKSEADEVIATTDKDTVAEN